MPGAADREPADQAQNAQDQWDGRAFQWAHCGCAQDASIQQRPGPAADPGALCDAVQPPVAAVSAQGQDAHADHEKLASIPSASVSQAAI